MRKNIIIFLSIILALHSFSFQISSIKKKHGEGLFIEFTSVGYSFNNSEFLTQPLLDIVGIFNLNYRFYSGEFSIFSSQNYFIDPFFCFKNIPGRNC